ncbi:MAG: hypothetical protein RDU30_02295 [Desulfovibrionaceae bacterium]|nr:hypothetical protein [Desulfovibrionaceae bacterium]
MKRPFCGQFRAMAALMLAVFLLTSCVLGYPPPPALVLAEPSAIPGAVSTPAWDVAVQGYADDGQGLDFSKAGLMPVLVILRNKTPGYPLVDPAEVRGLAPGREYAPYPPLSAADVAEATSAFEESAKAILRGGVAGAVIGAGVGTLLGAAVGGGAALWRGALIGGGIGAFTGAVSSLPEARYQLRRGIETELETLALRPVPAPPYGMTAGYVYFPAGAGIGVVRVTVRDQSAAYSYDVPIAAPAPAMAPRPTAAAPAYPPASLEPPAGSPPFSPAASPSPAGQGAASQPAPAGQANPADHPQTTPTASPYAQSVPSGIDAGAQASGAGSPVPRGDGSQ